MFGLQKKKLQTWYLKEQQQWHSSRLYVHRGSSIDFVHGNLLNLSLFASRFWLQLVTITYLAITLINMPRWDKRRVLLKADCPPNQSQGNLKFLVFDMKNQQVHNSFIFNRTTGCTLHSTSNIFNSRERDRECADDFRLLYFHLPLIKVNENQETRSIRLHDFSGLWFSKSTSGPDGLLPDIWGQIVCCSCGATFYYGWDQYMGPSISNSLAGNTRVEEARDGRDENVTLWAYVIVNDLLKLWTFWVEQLSLLICRPYSFLQNFYKFRDVFTSQAVTAWLGI